jgi:hypothetical protein
MDILNTYLVSLKNETFNQCNFVGSTWLFITADKNWHFDLKLDLLNNQLQLNTFNRNNEKSCNYYFNLRKNVTILASAEFIKYQNKKMGLV